MDRAGLDSGPLLPKWVNLGPQLSLSFPMCGSEPHESAYLPGEGEATPAPPPPAWMLCEEKAVAIPAARAALGMKSHLFLLVVRPGAWVLISGAPVLPALPILVGGGWTWPDSFLASDGAWRGMAFHPRPPPRALRQPPPGLGVCSLHSPACGPPSSAGYGKAFARLVCPLAMMAPGGWGQGAASARPGENIWVH